MRSFYVYSNETAGNRGGSPPEPELRKPVRKPARPQLDYLRDVPAGRAE